MHTELVDIPFELPEMAPRSEGVHVSRVIRALAARDGLLAKEWCEDLSLVDVNQEQWWNGLDRVSQIRISMGLAWEEWYAKVLADQMGVIFHPGECCIDGIYMTPDGESLSMILHDAVLVVHEIKLTYKSTNTVKNLLGQWMWLSQVKAYCKAKGTLMAFVHVLFVCGDYTRPIRPKLLTWLVTFSQDEIDAGWELITDYVRYQMKLETEDAMRDTEGTS